MFVARVVVVSLLAVMLPFSGLTAQSKQKAGDPRGNPFQQKEHRTAMIDASGKQRFLQELEGVGQKLAARPGYAADRTSKNSGLMQTAELQRLREINGGPVQVVMDNVTGTPIYIRGRNLLRVTGTSPGKLTSDVKERRSMQFLAENKRLLGVTDPEQEFVRTDMDVDELGMTHIRYQQRFRGIEIWARDIRVHLTRDGSVESFNGRMMRTPTDLGAQRMIVSEEQAVRTAQRLFPGVVRGTSTKNVIDVDEQGFARICWLVNTHGALDQNWMTFVDAETGEVRRSYNHVFFDGPVTGSGTDLLGQTRALNLYQAGSVFYMVDASKQMFDAGKSTLPQNGTGVMYTLDAKNADSSLYFVTSNSATSWTNASAVSASANGSKVYDYYNTVHSRNAIDAKGTTMSMVVKFKVGFNNAFWNGSQMVFGTGDGTNFGDLAASLDVTGHEMTHGVVEHTANLVYENQAGALNESFADIFGALTEFWVDPVNGNWSMGESVTTPSVAGDALRRLDDPAATNIAFNGQQPTKMSEYQNLPNTEQGDHGGVHTNSGIPNFAFYKFATSASAGISLVDAGRVYYRALSLYLTRNAKFVDCRLAVIKAAEDLNGGPGNAWALAAAAAFDAVEITDGAATPPPPEQPPVVGSDFLAVIDAATFGLYRTGTNGTPIVQMSAAPLYSRPTTTDDGALILYIDATTNVHSVQSDGTNDQALTSNGGFNNISISPNGRYLAATSTSPEATIYLFDLQSGGGAQAIPLYTPTYSEGVTGGTILYPDRIDWASDSQMLMYDALNEFTTATGDTTQYWDINLVRVTDGVVGRLFPPQAPGVNIGNAVFASNTDNIIAFDYFAEGDSVRVLAVNLNTSTIGQVTNNWFSLGSPTFSSDDQTIFYHYIDQSGAAVFAVSLAQDGITGTGNDQVILNGAIYPVAFTVGNRTTDVPAGGESVPARFGLRQNYPNPFNPATTLTYDLEREGPVSVKIFDLLGREVADLVRASQPAGTYTIMFDAGSLPTGMYVVRLQAEGKESVRRISLIR